MARTSATSTLTLAQLERLLNKRRRDLGRLEKQRAKVQKRLDAIDAKIVAAGGSAGGGGRGGGRASGGRGRSRARNDLSLQDAIHQILSKSGGPMSVTDIMNKVLATGYKSNSANFRGIVNQTLIKDKRFAAAERGVYQLKK